MVRKKARLRYWLFQVMYHFLPKSWEKMLKHGLAAQHYPEGWLNAARNRKRPPRNRKARWPRSPASLTYQLLPFCPLLLKNRETHLYFLQLHQDTPSYYLLKFFHTSLNPIILNQNSYYLRNCFLPERTTVSVMLFRQTD